MARERGVGMTPGGLNDAVMARFRAALPERVFKPISDHYLTEPRGLFQGTSGLVLAPSDTGEVARILAIANEAKIAVVPFGGGTGLVGGQVNPTDTNSVILSLERMRVVRDIDPRDNVITVEAGCVLDQIHRAAEEVDRLFPLSLASEGTCQIGGNLATNAGGIGVLRYGNARALCLGLELVLPNGRIWNGLSRLAKDNSGYDLRDLMIGSEGTLGVITAASLRLFQRPKQVFSAVAQVTGPDEALDLLMTCQERLGGAVQAFELIHGNGLEFLAEKLPKVRRVFDPAPPWMVLADFGGPLGFDLQDKVEDILSSALETGAASDVLISQSDAQRRDFWTMRETIPEANRLVGSISSQDISVPLGRIPEFIARAGRAIAAIDDTLRINCFGHVGDGNLHYNVFPPKGKSSSAYVKRREEIRACVYDLVDGLQGSFAAEHGVGRLKRGELEKYGDPVRLQAMAAIKAALDPNGIMNPGAVIAAH